MYGNKNLKEKPYAFRVFKPRTLIVVHCRSIYRILCNVRPRSNKDKIFCPARKFGILGLLNLSRIPELIGFTPHCLIKEYRANPRKKLRKYFVQNDARARRTEIRRHASPFFMRFPLAFGIVERRNCRKPLDFFERWWFTVVGIVGSAGRS